MWETIAYELRPEILLRVALTLITGVILGVEREQHGRAAGLRTVLLVSLAACLAMIVSDSFYLSSLAVTGTDPAWHPDPARLAAGVLSGMGFLGAGVIIRQTSHVVRGVTTAATLWFATVIGLAYGAKLESRIQDDWYSDFTVQLDSEQTSIDAILTALKSFSIKVKGIDVQTSQLRPEQRVVFHLKFKKADLVRFPIEVTERVNQVAGVQETHWHA
jgi:putative Mg2+ transporter-C (MgtC) family protein